MGALVAIGVGLAVFTGVGAGIGMGIATSKGGGGGGAAAGGERQDQRDAFDRSGVCGNNGDLRFRHRNINDELYPASIMNRIVKLDTTCRSEVIPCWIYWV